MIEGLGVRIGPEAVVVVAAQPLRVLSSAVHNGIAATGRGARARFGGPASELGWSMAQAARRVLAAGIRGWHERNP